MRQTLLPLLLLCASGTAALAADIEASSSIDSVTVFPDGAQVTRVVPLALPAGSSMVTLKGLASKLDPASVRVEAQGQHPLLIGPVETRLAAGDPRPRADAAQEAEIEALKAERLRLDGRIGAAEGKKRAIERYAEAGPEKLSADVRPLAVDQWSLAWDAIGAGLARVNDELGELAEKTRLIDAEIAALEAARARPAPPGAPRHDVGVAIDAEDATSAVLKITYRVKDAFWQPLYDARLDTGSRERKPSLELVRRAKIAQSTGEDWSGVALTVSTTRTARGSGAPDLVPLVVSFGDGDEQQIRAKKQVDRSLPDAQQAFGAVQYRSPLEAAPIEAAESFASSSAGAFQASFRVPGKISIPQDGTVKTFALASRRVEPALIVKAVPALDETAYLETTFTLEDDVPLLPGEAALHRDGVYVGRGRIALTAPGDKVELGFGADDRVKVTRLPLRQREGESGWIGGTLSNLREIKTTVRNLHDMPIRVTLLDRIPVSQTEAIAVEQIAPTTAPTDKNVGDKPGVMGWTFDYQPGEQKEIRLAYRVKWPSDRKLSMR